MTNIYHAELSHTSPHGNGTYYEQELNFFDVLSNEMIINTPGDAFIDTIALVEISVKTANPLTIPLVRAQWANSDFVNMQGQNSTMLHVPLSPAAALTYNGSYHSRPVILLHKNGKKLRNASQSIKLRIFGSAGENIDIDYLFMRLYVRYMPFTCDENPSFMSAILTV